MAALDEDEKKQFKQMPTNEKYLLELVLERNNARCEYELFHEIYTEAVIDEQVKLVRQKQAESFALGQKIAELKKRIEERNNTNNNPE